MLLPREGNNNRKQSLAQDNGSMRPNSPVLTSLDMFTPWKKEIKGRFINPRAAEPHWSVTRGLPCSPWVNSSPHWGEKGIFSFLFYFQSGFQTPRPKRPAVDTQIVLFLSQKLNHLCDKIRELHDNRGITEARAGLMKRPLANTKLIIIMIIKINKHMSLKSICWSR